MNILLALLGFRLSPGVVYTDRGRDLSWVLTPVKLWLLVIDLSALTGRTDSDMVDRVLEGPPLLPLYMAITVVYQNSQTDPSFSIVYLDLSTFCLTPDQTYYILDEMKWI